VFSSSEPSLLLLANKRTKRFSSDVTVAAENKDRKPSISDPVPSLSNVSEESKKANIKRGPGRPKKFKLDSESGVESGSFEMSTISEQLENILLRPEKNNPTKKMKDTRNSQDVKKVSKKVKEGEDVEKKAKFTKDVDIKKEKHEAMKTKSSFISESHFAQVAEYGKHESSFSEDSSDDDVMSAESLDNESSDTEPDSSDESSSVTSSVDKERIRRGKERRRARHQSSESRSKIAGNTCKFSSRKLWSVASLYFILLTSHNLHAPLHYNVSVVVSGCASIVICLSFSLELDYLFLPYIVF
jgi:hypothetical protein